MKHAHVCSFKTGQTGQKIKRARGERATYQIETVNGHTARQAAKQPK